METTAEKLIEISYNIEDQAGNKLVVVDFKDAEAQLDIKRKYIKILEGAITINEDQLDKQEKEIERQKRFMKSDKLELDATTRLLVNKIDEIRKLEKEIQEFEVYKRNATATLKLNLEKLKKQSKEIEGLKAEIELHHHQTRK